MSNLSGVIEVSIVVPVHNGMPWLEECLNSIMQQTFSGMLELSVYDDASIDGTWMFVEAWRGKLAERNISLVISGHPGSARGVGYAKNQAVRQSSGQYICFIDADDVMHPERVSAQLAAAKANPNSIIGCRFHRDPPDSTARYTNWANSLSAHQLQLQVYTSHGPTVIMPTWFCDRSVFHKVGGFDETGKGTPEDLLFFYKHLELGGAVHRVDTDLLMYRYHPKAETFSISEDTIWSLRVQYLEQQVLCGWDSFSIWNAGKQGRKLYRFLTPENRKKVAMFCDVDERKIRKGHYTYEDSEERPKPKIPVVHFTSVKPPIVICMKMGLAGNFEENLASLDLTEGKDYIHFN